VQNYLIMTPDPNAFPDCYLDPNIADTHLDASVKPIIAVAGPAITREVFGTMVNHWRLFLFFPLTRRFYMVKTSGPDVRGIMGFMLKPYAVSNRSVKQVELRLGRQICTVRKAWTLLHNKGFWRYKYTTKGECCLVAIHLETRMHLTKLSSLLKFRLSIRMISCPR
jgi:hypothetical protein